MRAGYYVNVLSHYRPGNSEGVIGLVVEYMATTGAPKSGKVQVELPAITGAFLVKNMRTRIREAVAKALGVDAKTIIVMGD